MGWEAFTSKLHEHSLYAEKSETTSTCNGARIIPMRLLLTQCSPKPLTQLYATPENATGLLADHAKC